MLDSTFYFHFQIGDDDNYCVRRYYTIEPFNLDCIKIDPIKKLQSYFYSMDITALKCDLTDKEFLEHIGVKINQLKETPYTLYFQKKFDNFSIDDIEKELIKVAEMMNIAVKPVVRYSDLNNLKGQIVGSAIGAAVGPINNSVIGGVIGSFINNLNDKFFYKSILKNKRKEKDTDDKTDKNALKKEGIIKKEDISNDAFNMESYVIDILDSLKSQGNTVIITDNYLFPKTYDDIYKKYLKNILNHLKAKKIIHLGNERAFNKNLFDYVKFELSFSKTSLNHENVNDFHDRFWITKETLSGMVIGSSLNGIGKKFCYYNELNRQDVETILNYLNL